MLCNRWCNLQEFRSVPLKGGASANVWKRSSGTGELFVDSRSHFAAVAYAYDYFSKAHAWTLNSGMDPASVQYTVQQMNNFKEIDKVPSYSSTINDSYIKSVLATLGTVPESRARLRPAGPFTPRWTLASNAFQCIPTDKWST